MVVKLFATYNDIHQSCADSAAEILANFKPDLMVAIGGGGYIPARILRTFLKGETGKNIPIQAIGLSLYEELGETTGQEATGQQEKLGKEVVRTQWLDFSTLGSRPLLGRKILIVDEVDDSRTTLSYAVSELQKDISQQLAALPAEKRDSIPPTEFAIFVVHNKLKEKLGTIPDHVKYFSGQDVEDIWINYPWESRDIAEHDRSAAAARKETGQ